jgi:PTH1 family peptidyl-tRNA hydrolase
LFLVAGLGNPGEDYANTPHNVGFMVVDRLAERHSIRVMRPDSKALIGTGEIDGQPVMLAKPLTFMNLSGTSLKPLMTKHEIKPADLILVYDELDLPWPSVRVRPRGSAGSHNGVKSVVASLGTEDFPRVRLGIDTGRTDRRDGAAFVLAPFRRSQEKELDELIGFAADAVDSIIADGVEKAMTKFNRRAAG